MTQCPAIQIENCQFRYHPDSDKALLQIAHWRVEKGETVFVYGPSGSGKSTLLNLLAGILLPQQGNISLDNVIVNRLSHRKRDAFRARHIGMVFQRFNLIPYLTVADNIKLASHFSLRDKQYLQQRRDGLLNALQLDPEILMRPASQLSVGQQQRVAIVRALINEPELLIVDEPTSALDSDARDSFVDLLLDQIKAAQATLLFVSHDRSLARHFSRQLDIQSFVDAGENHAV
ncbi:MULTISPECIES: ATP-binding cassette domain-containing protein [unclassified Methylophaga]|jgi:putative ABC transport system ATP-binding protein|uniref:ATP-binding cassette domain-containing protein n=1 Tax=unclassified Methylophaga TaxID=2629249 RepID=UPI000C9358F5|nr:MULTISPECIES: ATP-binding cassette domain-containing protein [unclassified Methylophaga]MAK65669.1 ABC transporter ATP-binding protein [Methylophaga sp.]MAY16392.1 ABC transporter ATP-binding protein [Methylophaga sp.]|tara:strand:- start:3786 stop:4481 length:696 start_codon:yes stop_codon:yes gene_type:complete